MFRVYSSGSNKIIYDINIDSVLQVSNQETSTTSQVSSFFTSHFWQTSYIDINMKLLGYLPQGPILPVSVQEPSMGRIPFCLWLKIPHVNIDK